MTVCRYFEKGNCRYGDRCRFEHIKTNYDSYNQRNVGNYQERSGRYETGYSDYYQNDYQQKNQRYESRNYYENQREYSPERYETGYSNRNDNQQRNQRNYYEDQRKYSPERYQDSYHYQSPTRSGGYDNQYQNRYKQNYDQQQRYNEQNYARRGENVYSQNRFQWLSEDYGKHNQQSVQHRKNNYAQDSYQTSTPKGKVSFSFKVPESEIKQDNNTLLQMNEQDISCAETVTQDAKSWELGGQWPFTCYFPCAGKHAFPGFYDISPEELRYAAYNAEKNNSYETYIQNIQNAVAQINHQRSELQVATPQLLNILKRIRNGEDLYSTSKKINPISSASLTDTVVETMETAAFSFPASNAAASFSFKIPTETDSIAKTSADNFSFKLPVSTEIKAVSSTVSDGDINIYTSMGNLTDEEKEQFCASTFVLGKIPTKPPPQGLCI